MGKGIRSADNKQRPAAVIDQEVREPQGQGNHDGHVARLADPAQKLRREEKGKHQGKDYWQVRAIPLEHERNAGKQNAGAQCRSNLHPEEDVREKRKRDEDDVIQEILIRERREEDRIPRPVERIVRPEVAQEIGHADVQIPVCAKECGDRELDRDEKNETYEKNTER